MISEDHVTLKSNGGWKFSFAQMSLYTSAVLKALSLECITFIVTSYPLQLYVIHTYASSLFTSISFWICLLIGD